MKLVTAFLLLPTASSFIYPIQNQLHAQRGVSASKPFALRSRDARAESDDSAADDGITVQNVDSNGEIDNSLSDSEETTDVNFSAMLLELEALARDSVVQIDFLQGEVSKKDGELEKLSNERDNLSGAMENLKMILADLETTLEKSDEKTAILERDNESMTNQVQHLSDTLVQVKVDSTEEMSKLKSDTASAWSKLEVERDSLQSMLVKNIGDIDLAKAGSLKAQQESEQTVRQQKEDSKKFEKKMRQLVTDEKKIIKQQMWDLETKLKDKEYKRLVAVNEVRALKKIIAQFDTKIVDLEVVHEKATKEQGERMNANKMFYVKSNIAARKRLVDMVEKFQRRHKRQEEISRNNMERLRIDLESKYEAKKNDLIADYEAKDETSKNNMETLRILLENQFDDERGEIEADFDAKEELAKAYLEDFRFETESRFEAERDEVVAMFEAKLEDARIEMETLRVVLENQFEDERNELVAGYEVKEETRNDVEVLRTTLQSEFDAERNDLIASYEAKLNDVKMQADFRNQGSQAVSIGDLQTGQINDRTLVSFILNGMFLSP